MFYGTKDRRFTNVSELLGKTLVRVNVDNAENEIYFFCNDGKKYVMYHEQDCCESVEIEDITGALSSLINSPLTMAEETITEGETDDIWDCSYTATWYKFATVKGYVTIRWYGTSNGYYSEEVSFAEVLDESTSI
jgi:hypothetical protein